VRLSALVGLVVAVALALTPVAQAGPGKGKVRRAAAPAGQLQVSGTGAITLTGQLTAVGVIPSAGTLTVTDLSGDARLTVNGRPRPLSRGVARVPVATGQFYVKGGRVKVRVSGVGVSLSAAGRGRAALAGVGTYALNGSAPQSWPPNRGVVELLPQPT
jgi:hypothetical protein